MTSITLGFHADGSAELIFGPEVPAKDQRKAVEAAKREPFSPGVVRVEVWAKNRVKLAIAKPAQLTEVDGPDGSDESKQSAKKSHGRKNQD